MTLSIGFKTDIGRKRENNEDSYAVLRGKELDGRFDTLVVVADGMGGARNGDVASGIVAQTLPEAIQEFVYERANRPGAIDIESLLRDSILRVNNRVWMRAVERKELHGMGTTCVAAIVHGDALTIGNVGDSRAYLLRDGKLSQITEDHSEVWQQVKAGSMTREEARTSKFRNRITQAIGLSPNVTPDVDQMNLQAGDTVLLCTDGLTTEVGDSAIARMLASEPTAQEACDRLVATALRNGGSDNITVVVLRYGEFAPLSLPDAPAEEETPTDPDQRWRENAPRNGFQEADEDYEDEEAEHLTPLSRRSEIDEEERAAQGGGGCAITVIALLLVLAIAEGIGLFVALKHREVKPFPTAIAGAANPEGTKPTDRVLEYDVPQLYYKGLLRDSPLVIDDEKNLYAVSMKDGRLLKIGPGGISTPLSSAEAADRSGAMNGGASTGVYLAFDASGNRYQSNREGQCIERFTGMTRNKQIGQGHLKSPASVAVDTDGNLYVIDNHRLMKLNALQSWNDRMGELRQSPETTPAAP